MASLSPPTATPVHEPARWTLVALLTASICINYADRGNLSVGIAQIIREIPLTPADEGLLFSAFFWTYASCLFLSSFIIDRFPVTRLFAAGYALWSLATVVTAAAQGFVTLLVPRLFLGVGESVAYPSYSKILATRFTETERGTANAWIDAGSKAGPALGVLGGGLLLQFFGWRGMFLILGAAGMLWLIPWHLTVRRVASLATPLPASQPPPPLLEIISRRDAWATFLGLFAGNYLWYFLLTWLPPYLVMKRHYTTYMMAFYGSLPFWGVAASSLFSGWLSDRLILAGADPSRVRRRFGGYGLLASVLLLPAYLAHSNRLSMILLVAACLSYGAFSSNVWAITQSLAGPRAAAKWTGLQNAFGNLAGVTAPWVTGQILNRTGSFYWAFATVAGVAFFGGFCYFSMVRSIKEVNWKTE